MFGRKKPAIGKSGIDYEQLGRAVEKAVINDYIYLIGSTKRQIWGAFWRGIFTGLGGVIGASLIVALLLLILNLLGGVPVLGPLFQNIGNNIHSTNNVHTTR